MDGFLENRQSITEQNIKVVLGTPLGPSAAPSSPFGAADPIVAARHMSRDGNTSAHETRVETVVDEGRVVRIIVTCSCGEVTEIDCDYSDE